MHTDASPRKGINSQTTPHASIEEFLAAVGVEGIRFVELAADIITRPVGEILELLAASGTSVLGVCPSTELVDWHWRWEDTTTRLLEVELTRAAELGADYFVMPFMRPQGTAESIRAGLELAVPVARELNIALAVEPIGHFDVLRTGRELAPVLETQDPAVVGLLLDSFHFFRAGQSVDEVSAYDGVPILALQLSNINDSPLDEALGYRDRRFPLDGRMPVLALCERVLTDRPGLPLVVEVIGDVAAHTATADGVRCAREQLDDIHNALKTQKAGNA